MDVIITIEKKLSRLVRMHNEVVTTSTESQKTIKTKISQKAENLSALIVQTRRKLLDKVGLGHVCFKITRCFSKRNGCRNIRTLW